MAEQRYFICNPAGAIHEVSRADAEELLKGERGPGYRPATQEQVKLYLGKVENDKRLRQIKKGGKKQVIQRADDPIGERWDPVPEGFDIDEMFADVEDEPEPEPEPKPAPKKKAPAKKAE